MLLIIRIGDGQEVRVLLEDINRPELILLAEPDEDSDDDNDGDFANVPSIETPSVIRPEESTPAETTENDPTVGHRLKWGELTGIKDITEAIENVYSNITTWKKNTFQVPRGKAGKDYISELSRLLKLFNTSSKWESAALNMLVIFCPLMLQKPSARSKGRDHSRYLSKRLQLWSQGKLDELVSEANEIQKRMKPGKKREENVQRDFTRLMLEGKVKQALKLVDSDNEITGVHTMNQKVRDTLMEKHPPAEPANPQALIPGQAPRVEEVIFEAIDGKTVQAAAKSVHGSGGPTRGDADNWKDVLCSKVFGKLSEELSEEVAVATRRLCVEDIPHQHIKLLLDNRLVPLMKENDGVRPIGIGEVLRRIMGRCVTKIVGNDVQLAGGTLQTCTGVEAGIEAAIHGISRVFKSDSCEAFILVDADNAFNRLNRKSALHNVERLCPPLHRFLNNTYKEPSRLHLGDGTYIWSEEGATQGDPLAMPKYSVSTRPIIDSLHENTTGTVQVWFADDANVGGKLEYLKPWWDHLKFIGPSYGYYVQSKKTIMVVKSQEIKEKAMELFANEGIEIRVGHRQLGAVIGSETFKVEYIRNKVEKWVKDVTDLAKIAKEEPQAAHSAFNVGLSQRWTFIQRTVQGIADLFHPLENAIREQLIPAICGRHVSDIERRLFALPYRYGGLGIRNPVETADTEYEASTKVTQPLADLIVQQEMDLSRLDRDKVKEIKLEVRAEKERKFKAEEAEIALDLDEKTQRLVKCAQEKGASSWLSALPLKRMGYSINKQEFRDAISLRYGWTISDMPSYCACGKKNSIDHVMICLKGGYVHMRHNALRDTEAKMLKQVCKDVKTEPQLIPTAIEWLKGSTAPNARPDISARGLWSPCERTFFDVRVTHRTAESHMNKSLDQLYLENEAEKKIKYGERVRNVEKASFTPLVFTTTGGMGPECTRMNKRLAELICNKTNEKYSHVVRHLRTRLRFALLRTSLIAIRGFRGRSNVEENELEMEEISFNLIPQAKVD